VASTLVPQPVRVHARKPLRAAVVGADEMARRRVCDAVLAHAGRIELALEAASADALMEQANGTPDVVILVHEGERAALEAAVRELCDGAAELRAIVVSADEAGATVQASLRAGAAGFVSAASLPAALGPCVEAVASDFLAVPREGRSAVERRPLTSREKQTLALVVMGFTNYEIATKLYLAESTVKSHLSSAFSKLGVRSRSEAAELILDPNSGVGTGILTIPT